MSLTIPPGIDCAQDYERLAVKYLPASVLAYIAGGCGRDLTATANLQAFDTWSLYPRILRDVRQGHTQIQVGVETWAHPIGLAPVAYQQLAHANAELDTARAAQVTDTCMVVSTLSSLTLEDIACHAGDQRWFQLYLQANQADTFDLMDRAEAAGYRALVVTLDATIQTASLRALRAGFSMPKEIRAANLHNYPGTSAAQSVPGSVIFQGAMQQAPRWQHLDAVLARSRLPVWVKGVLHPDDAASLKARGVAGIVVSNHGGRSLDGAPASLKVLPAIRAAVGPGYPLILDGGIRSGSDAFKALALGAQAVLIGRLQVYALSVAGALGVAHLLKLLREELEICMAMTGCASVSAIGPEALLLNEDGRNAC